MLNRAIVLLALSLVLVSCAPDMPASGYTGRAGEFVRSGEEGRALEVLRSGIYRYPDDYELNLLMARTLLARYADLTPHARSRYLARHYLKRAASLAPDKSRAEAARREYERIRETQREVR